MNYAEYVRREAEKYTKKTWKGGSRELDRLPNYTRADFMAGVKSVERIKWLEGMMLAYEDCIHMANARRKRHNNTLEQSINLKYGSAKAELELLMGGGKDG